MSEAQEKKKIILSGIQPTGVFTLGNYLGAVKNWQQMQEDYQCYYFIADLHSLTVHIDPKLRKQQSLQAFALAPYRAKALICQARGPTHMLLLQVASEHEHLIGPQALYIIWRHAPQRILH